jgi:predicted metal-binding membrane protein
MTTTLGLAAASWVITLQQMKGMDMGGSIEPGSFGSFLTLWVPMMAAMMLPAAVPAVLRRTQADGRARTLPLFLGSYLLVWTPVGAVVYAGYRPLGSFTAGIIVIAAGIYELSRLKQDCRRRCQDRLRSGFDFGIYCVGSSLGLMLMLVVLGLMSFTWMLVIALLVLAQKLLPPNATVDVPVALAIVTLGILNVVAPSWVPGLMPPM